MNQCSGRVAGSKSEKRDAKAKSEKRKEKSKKRKAKSEKRKAKSEKRKAKSEKRKAKSEKRKAKRRSLGRLGMTHFDVTVQTQIVRACEWLSMRRGRSGWCRGVILSRGI